MTSYDETMARADALGRDAGVAAASWIFDGSTDRAAYARVLAGITDGDPMVLDAYRVPDLSGEFADGYTPRDLAIELDLDPDDADDADAIGTVCDAWEAGASEGFWHEVERIARVQLQVREPGYFTCPCCGDVAIGDGMTEVCDDCSDAGCESARDACGEPGYWDCQWRDGTDAWYPGASDSSYGPLS
jgi:hypothetical protein